MPETIEIIELSQATRERYLRYALSVITARALPDVRDGLKPVQRRILYAMYADLHLRPTNRHMKSAKVVGQVIGNYHPHGDTAIYDAMVRMAQPFSLRYPLVDGQGNFGAITGDSAAAFRYTEARLRPLGAELSELLGEETVDTRPTYDETGTEPEVLPVPAPVLLLNGAAGIAVGMATNIPPHNLSEVVKACTTLIDKPDSTPAQLMRHIKGPDFPTGGEILASRSDIRTIYENGTGSVKVRGTYSVEEARAKGQRVARRYLVVTSVPYGTNTGAILSKIKELIEAKKLPGVSHASDQTRNKDDVRIVLELKADVDETALMGAIYRLTPLQINYSINLTCLLPTGTGVGRPVRHADIKTLLQAWLDFRFEVVTRSLQYRKRKLEERIHILEGFDKALGKINDAIKIIRAAKDRPDAQAKLQKRFKLSELQARAVLELMLYRLAQLEVKKIKEELAAKKKEASRLGRLLKGKKPRWDLIKKELIAFGKRHGKGDKRLSTLVGQDETHTYDPDALIKKEDTHVILTREGRLKRLRQVEDTERIRMREGDELHFILQGSTLALVVFFTNFGSAYVMKINDVPATTGFGEPIQKFFNFKDNERVVLGLSLDSRLCGDPNQGLVVAMAGGNTVRVPFTPHLEVSTRSGRKFVRLGKGDEVVRVEHPERRPRHILLVTSKGNGLRFPFKEVVEVQGVGKGKRGIRLKKKERVVGMTCEKVLHVLTTRGGHYKLKMENVPVGEGGTEGIKILERFGFRHQLPPTLQLYELPEDE